jgi:hypothetical protein
MLTSRGLLRDVVKPKRTAESAAHKLSYIQSLEMKGESYEFKI